MLEEQARNDRVNADALPAASGAGHEQVGHRGQIGNDCVTVDILTESQWQGSLGRFPGLALEELPDTNLHLTGVGDLDTDGVLAGNRRQDVDALGASGTGEVFFQSGDALHPDSDGRIHLVPRDGWPLGDVTGRCLDVKLSQRIEDDFLDRLERGRIGRLMRLVVVAFEKIERRQGIFPFHIRQRGDSTARSRFLLGLHHLGKGWLASRGRDTGIDDLGCGKVGGGSWGIPVLINGRFITLGTATVAVVA